ncbi:MAG: DUF2510 domain-containing protein [Acidimicrobiaceae bacterium]|nr:DUF2510 domain-containing protein [Acidimicrobiaceae bacterium]MXZ65449.1 DUF2510 domain-containing protein [Acidimicrobiaceae bacterium]MYF34265.1 DUF2510 domain-containing protein [Acidimicrobiaceae bacterium]MYG80132.1 DUF2510 domain-containing protein [Acidimicrobiaceae bacterium]MYJ82931.1 DUF2510 domain-containing protein [Acidimicrobiaceae bacterium]
MVRVAGVSDLPPADWYTDPEDESQYRYWDGSSWTEHRAPRIIDTDAEAGDATVGLRSPTKLVADTFSLTGRRWRPCVAVALIYVLSQIAGVVLLLVAANNILMGELGAIFDRVSQPGFDASDPEHEAYFESLAFDLAPINLVLALLGLLALWIASNLMQAAVTRIALSDLHDRAVTTSDTLRQAMRRVPRLMGVDLIVVAIFLLAAAAMVLTLIGAPLLLIPLIPAFIAGAVYAIVVLPMAYAVASAGPRTWSLPYGARLVRGRFWATLGRLLLVVLVLFAVSLAVGIVSTLAGTSGGTALELVSQLVQTVVSAGLAVVGIVAAAILYDDLGGESD